MDQKIRTFNRALLFLVVAVSVLLVDNAFAQQPAARAGQISVIVVEKACATGATQCTQGSHTSGVPAAGNHQPVLIALQVLDGDNEPVNGLPSSAITTAGITIPAGGSDTIRDNCTDCFGAGPGGLYVIWMHPIGAEVWKSGTYTIQVQATYVLSGKQKTARGLTRIDIP